MLGFFKKLFGLPTEEERAMAKAPESVPYKVEVAPAIQEEAVKPMSPAKEEVKPIVKAKKSVKPAPQKNAKVEKSAKPAVAKAKVKPAPVAEVKKPRTRKPKAA